MEITKQLLVRYLNCETSLAEEKDILEWLEADEKHRKELDEMDFVFGSSVMGRKTRPRKKRFFETTFGRTFASVSAIIIAAAAALYTGAHYSENRFESMASAPVSLSVPVGQRVNMTLADGTKVTLNSGATITYPSAFNGRTRTVSIDGEGMFDVAHDAEHPFIVKAAGFSVTALGTKFAVKADEESSSFSTALLEGSIKVCNTASAMSLVLQPGEKVSSLNGTMVKEEISDRDDFLWTDGIISLGGKSFEDLMKNYESAYGFNIIYRTDSIPQIRCSGKIRIADGIEHAISVLQKGGTDFSYEINYNLNEVYIW